MPAPGPLSAAHAIGDGGHVADHNAIAAKVDSIAEQTHDNVYNVLDYGAVADGVTDDQPAIQAAIDAARGSTDHTVSAGGAGTVLFPYSPTPYLIGSPIVTDSRIRMIGGLAATFGATRQTTIKAKTGGSWTSGVVTEPAMLKPPVARVGANPPSWWFHSGWIQQLCFDCSSEPCGGIYLWRPGETSVVEQVQVRATGTISRSVTDGATTAASAVLTSATAAFTSDDVAAYITGGSVPAIGDVRTVTDGATTNASQTLTSATANFTAADVTASISGAGIPASTSIFSVTNATTVLLSQNATATASGVTLTITRQRPSRVKTVDSATQVTLTQPVGATATNVPLTIRRVCDAITFEGSAAVGHLRDINVVNNSGAGIRLKKQGSGSWLVENVSGDNNGHMLRVDGASAADDPMSVTVINFKAENYTEPGKHSPAILLDGNRMLSFNLFGGSFITTFTEPEMMSIRGSAGAGPSVGMWGIDPNNPFNTMYTTLLRDDTLGTTIAPNYRAHNHPVILHNRELIMDGGGAVTTAGILGQTIPQDLASVTGTAASAVTTGALGDKLSLYATSGAPVYGFGVQANRLVAYIANTVNAGFAVRVVSASNAKSSGADVISLDINGHINTPGLTTNPTLAAGSAAGTTPPTPVLGTNAKDTRGSITFGTGSSPTAGNMAVVTFANAYTSAPFVAFTPLNSATAALNLYATSVGTGSFTIAVQTAPTGSQANTTYAVSYQVIG